MKSIKKIPLIIIVLLIGLTSCATVNSLDTQNLNKKIRDKITKSTFEVVVKKPEIDNLVYEKDLPWDLVPYQIRNDEYYSIGTAFAVSKTELYSAFHVIPLDKKSKNYSEYYIRDYQGNVYELDKVTAFNNSKDYIRFTIKDGNLESHFKIEEEYVINEPVFSVGNAYGEGVILRGGTLTGTIAEPENGAWLRLKSSSDVNSGNSGGPLLNSIGDVIGIVTNKKDNIAYSIPLNEVLKDDLDKGIFHYKFIYGFGLFSETLENRITDYSVDLPLNYKDVFNIAENRNSNDYKENMDELFSKYKGDIFPEGKNSLEALFDNTYSFMPQVMFKDKTSLKWGISNIETQSEVLHNNGTLYYSGLLKKSFIFNIYKPDEVELHDLTNDPKSTMDLILEGLNIPRKIGGQDIRIVSYGKPYQTKKIKDKYNRIWTQSMWDINFSDEVVMLYSLPTPKGVMGFVVTDVSSEKNSVEYDYTKMLDFFEISYTGTLDEWDDYLSLGDIIPAKLKNLSYVKTSNNIEIDTNILNVSSFNRLFSNKENIELTLDYDIFNSNSKTVWDIKRVVLSEKNRDNFVVLYNNQKPYSGLRKSYTESWDTLIDKAHPFNEVSFSENGLTKIGKLINPDINGKDIYSIYIGMENDKDINVESILNTIDVKIK